MSGAVIQSLYFTQTSNAPMNAPLPYNDTPPAYGSGGTNIMQNSITPTDVKNKLRVRIDGNWAADKSAVMTFALYRRDFLPPWPLAPFTLKHVNLGYTPSSWIQQMAHIEHQELAAVLDPVQFTLIIGSTPGVNYYINGDPAIMITGMGGMLKWTMVLEEIQS